MVAQPDQSTEFRALRRLEEERREFDAFLARLHAAKDKQEFEQFLAARRAKPQSAIP